MKNRYRKINKQNYTLGDLVQIVSSCARNERETVAALADLFASGRVVIRSQGSQKRARASA